ncbi:MAG: type II secretion system F family protein [Bowdeniella nasicola]|nr:type II secretion system F family protein [Bowdeniella nasicola]
MSGTLVGLLLGSGLVLVWSGWRSPASRSGFRPSRVQRLLLDAGLSRVSVSAFIAATLAAAVLGAAVVLVFTTGVVISSYAALACALTPWVWVHERAKRQRAVISGMWPDIVENLIAAIRSGLPLSEAVASLADTGPPAAREGFLAFRRSLRVTGRIDEALDAVKDHFADPVADRIVEALRVAKDVGGSDLGSVLRTLASSLRAEAHARGELLARQSWTVNGARLAAAAPWLILAMLSMRPENARAFDSAEGLAVLGAGAVVTVIAHRLMRWIGRLPREPRSLA